MLNYLDQFSGTVICDKEIRTLDFVDGPGHPWHLNIFVDGLEISRSS
jgi:hypothetical protein